MDELAGLMAKCRRKARQARGGGERARADRGMWMERGARVALIAASQFIEMKVRFLRFLSLSHFGSISAC